MPAEEHAPEPVVATEASARVSHFRRWYLRPWFLLLLAILLPLGAYAYSLGMRARAAEILMLDNNGLVTPEWLQPVEKYLTFLPPACYQRLQSTSIDLRDPPMADDLLRQLRWFPELTGLSMYGSGAEGDEISVSGREPHVPVPEPFDFDLSCFVNLQSLELCGMRMSERPLEQLSRCPHLKTLLLERSGLTLPMAQKLGRLRTLKDLYIWDCGLTDELLNQLHGLDKLKGLRLRGGAITDDGLQVLSHLPSLRHLELAEVTLTERTFSLLNRLPLQQLRLYSDCSSDTEFAALSAPMPTLQRIIIVMPITGAALDTVACHPNLREITIHSDAVQVDAASRLRGLTHLVQLELNGKEIELPIGTTPEEDLRK